MAPSSTAEYAGRHAPVKIYALLLLSLLEVGFTSYMAYLQVAVIRVVCS